MDIKEKYINYFQKKDHKFLEPASLVPDNDTTLFTSAGIQQLVPYIANNDIHPLGNKLTNYQKCLRLTDIDNIGDTYHHTFFEMLGNWSMNDYFKKEVIEMSYEFLTKEIGLSPEKIAVSVFGGEENETKDVEAAEIWNNLGIPMERIAFLGYKDNWWPSIEEKGPCGTDTEIFYWRSNDSVPQKFDPTDDRWVEIWNNVFIQYYRNENMELIKLEKKYIDTGMGVERMTSIIHNLMDNYESEIFKPIIEIIQLYSNKTYKEEKNKKDMRIIADHIRAITMICADDDTISPSNKDRGYILRKLIRRLLISANNLEIKEMNNFLENLSEYVNTSLGKTYPYVKNHKERIIGLLERENEKFNKVILNGEKRLTKALQVLEECHSNEMDSTIIFKMYETYGIPLDLTYSFLDKNKIIYDKNKVNELIEFHKNQSRMSSKQKFGDGIVEKAKIKTLKR